MLRTSLSPAEIRVALVDDPALAELGLVDYGERVHEVGSDRVCLVVRPWEDDDHLGIDNGFDVATVLITVIPRRGPTRFEAEQSAIVGVLRLVPGDVCLAVQAAASPDLLRLGGVVYIDPDGFRAENLAEFGYHPKRVVIGIPATVEVAAQWGSAASEVGHVNRHAHAASNFVFSCRSQIRPGARAGVGRPGPH